MKRTPFLLLVACLFLVASEHAAHAQAARGFVVNRFEPSERGSYWFATESLDLRGPKARPAVGIIGDYAANPLTTFQADGSANQRVVESSFALHAGAVVNFVDRFRLALSLPLHASMSGQAQTINTIAHPAPSGGAVGDLRFGADVRIGGEYGEPFTLALGMRAWAPTGDESAYTGDGKWRVAEHLLFAGEAGIFAYGARVGYLYRWRKTGFNDVVIGGGELDFAASMGLRLANKRFTIGPEIFGSTQLDDAFLKQTSPVEALLGAHYAPISSVRLGAGIGRGLTRAYGSPDLRILFGIEWMMDVPPPSDRDGDGIIDDQDACPDQKGPKNDDPKKNGCPIKEEDRDGDGVLDKDDACPDVVGAKTEDPKTNGCPPDKDGDGVYDKDDACVDVPGIKTDDPKTNGCPADTDHDMILDKDDACPKEAGIKTDDPKTNGCPDKDKDGIVDALDACPEEPGPADPDPKKNGCPKAYIKAGEIKITDQVKFKTGSSEILPGKDSEEVLRAVFQVLNQHPEIKRVRIEGHTDSKGSAATNKKLSAARAASVAKWLVSFGIERDRLVSKGFGPERPIGDNATEEGRKNNRRVEFHIEGQDPAAAKDPPLTKE